MPLAKLRLTIPEGVWIGDLTTDYPGATVRILAALSDADAGVGLAEMTGEALPEMLAAMEGYEDVSTIDVLQHSETEAIVQFETTMPLLLMPARDSGVPLEMPFCISDGTAVWEVTAPNERLSELGTQLEAFGISFEVEYIRQRLTDEQLLTERQRELVQTAIDEGYYDTPRSATLTELSAAVDLAKSTASETLHRAEESIVKEFMDVSEPV